MYFLISCYFQTALGIYLYHILLLAVAKLFNKQVPEMIIYITYHILTPFRFSWLNIVSKLFIYLRGFIIYCINY